MLLQKNAVFLKSIGFKCLKQQHIMERIPFSPPRIDQAIIDEVTDTLRSGWITTGPKTKALEKKLAALTGIENILCVSSATSGLEVVMKWLGIKAGDEVIIPAYTYCATANVVVHCGATPIMVDINPDDFTMNIEQISQAISPRTKAIVPVDLGGMPIDYTALQELINNASVKALFQADSEVQKQLGRIAIVADAAHSLGAVYKGVAAAQFTDVSVFSFHAVKNLTTAEGGAICFNLPSPFDNGALYKKFNSFVLHGQNKDALEKYGQNKWEYDVEEAGYKCNLPDVLAAIGLVEIGRYASDTLPRRKAIFDAYQTAFSNCDWAELPIFETVEKTSSYHLYLLRIKGISLEQRNAIIQEIFDRGVSVNVHYKPLPLLTFYKNQGFDISDFPVSLDCFYRVITLPVYYNLTDEQVQFITGVIKEAVATITMNKSLC